MRRDFFKNAKWNNIRVNLTALLLYVFLTMILTFPLILHIDRYLDLGDPALNTWILAWDVHSLVSDPLNLFNANIFYPHQNALAFSEHLIANMVVAFPVILITHNPVLAYNIILFLSFVLSGFGMFLLINHYINNKYSAFLGGVVFAFCTIRFAHIFHIQLLTAQWIPFALLYLDKFLHKDNYKNLALLYVFYVLQTLSCWYFAFYTTITLGVYTLSVFVINEDLRKKICQHSYQMKLILFLICALAVISPFAFPYIQVAHDYGFTRTLDEVSLYSADVGDYILAPINNLIYGPVSYTFQANRNNAEHSLFPGITVIALSLYGFFLLMRLKLGDQSKLALIIISDKTQYIYLLIALIAFVLSLGHPLHFFGHALNIDLPYKYLFEYFPGFKSMRVPSRFGFIIMLSLSVLAAYGMTRFIGSKPKIKKLVISFIFVSLVISESIYAPVFNMTMPVGREIPEIYQWLANETGDFAVVELPSNSFIDTEYMYYSTYHWKKLVNGYSGFAPEEYSDTIQTLMTFPSNESIYLLRENEVKYVLIHSGELDRLQWNCTSAAIKEHSKEVSLKKEFSTDYVFEINSTYAAPRSNIIIGSSGFHAYENWSSIPTRWMKSDGTFTILSPDNGTGHMNLNALSFYHNRTLEAYCNEELLIRIDVPASFISIIIPLDLKKGVNTVRLHVPDGCERPCDTTELNNADSRCLSIAVQNVRVT